MSKLRLHRLRFYHGCCQEQDVIYEVKHVLWRAIALAEVISAIYVLLIFYVFSCRLRRDLCKYELVQIHQACDLTMSSWM